MAGLKTLLISIALSSVMNAIVSIYYIMYLMQLTGGKIADTGPLLAIMMFSAGIFGLFFGLISDIIGRRPLIIVGYLFSAFITYRFSLGTILNDIAPYTVLIQNSLQGIGLGFLALSNLYWLQILVGFCSSIGSSAMNSLEQEVTGGKASTMAITSFVSQLIIMVSAVVGGYILDFFSFSQLFFIGAVTLGLSVIPIFFVSGGRR